MSDKKDKFSVPVDRRGFLKGVAATGAMATIAAANPLAAGQNPAEGKTSQRSWKDRPEPIDESLITDAGKYDVVVVGAGTAGLLCTRVASMNGASVAVIETQPEKKYRHIGGEVGAINSKWALAHGAPEVDEEDFLRQWAQRNIIRHNPKRASYYVKNSGRIFDWLIKEAGKEWMSENSHIMSCPPKPNVIRDVSGWKFYYGTTIFRKMTDPITTWRWTELLKKHQKKSLADGAKWYFDHHAMVCDVDGSGAVTGVVAKRADGKYFRFNAKKGVVLSAGDFAGDKEMVTDILDELRNKAEAQGDINLVKPAIYGFLKRDGSSIKLGVWAGGHVEIGPRSYLSMGEPGAGDWHLMLNTYGERFCDEAANSYLSVPKNGVTTILHDANWQQVLEMMPPCHGSVDTAHTINWPKRLKYTADVKPGPPDKNWKPKNMMEMMLGPTYCANTLEELLDYMGCYKGEARKKALAEIAHYNKLCEKGVDEDFGKDPRILKATALKTPPFYGRMRKNDGKGIFSSISPGLCATTGLDTDADGRVLNSEFRPIKGLYAAGNNAGNRYIAVYQTPICGISLGMAMTEGYMLGEMLAKS